jgi:hypothetical protein
MSGKCDEDQDEEFWEYDLLAERMTMEAQRLMDGEHSDTRLETVADHMQRNNNGCFVAAGVDPTHPCTLAGLYAETHQKVQAFLNREHSDTRWLHLLALLIEVDQAGYRADFAWTQSDPALRAIFDQVPLGYHR